MNVQFIIILLSCAVLFGCETQEKKEPNIILFLVDDLGWTDAGVLGSDFYQTPNIDKLVSEGMLFTNAYAASPVCSPTRASILTGKYPARINLTDFIPPQGKVNNRPFAKMIGPEWTKQLKTSEFTLGEALQKRGYKTIHIGKWHLGEEEMYWPEEHGFDVNIGGWSAGSPISRGGGGYFSPFNNPKLIDRKEGEYLTERLASEAVNYIKKNKDRSFFMNFWLYNVHIPLQAREEKTTYFNDLVKDGTKHNNSTYAAMISHMDDALGLLMQSIKDEGLEKNTIFIFYSDNGGLVGKPKAIITSNYPLRSGKGDLYEGGVRVPLIIKWPGKIKANSKRENLVTSPDLYPTILSLISNEEWEKPNYRIDGKDFSPVLLEDKNFDRGPIFWHYPHYHPQGAKPFSAIRKGDWKLIQIFEEDSLHLYNLAKDVGETENLVKLYPKKTKELLITLENWRAEVNAQLPVENPNYDKEKEEGR